MASDRRLTTRAVLVTLLASMGALSVGLILAVRAGGTVEAIPVGQVFGRLAEHDAAAWLSLGVALLLLTPLVRLAGMLRDFLLEGQRRAAVSAGVVLLMLTVALVLGFQGRKLGQASSSEPAPVGSEAR